MMIGRALLVLALAAAVQPAAAQQRSERFADAVSPAPAASIGGLRPLGVAKWTALAGSIATAVYGFSVQQDADDTYDRLERLCVADAERCAERLPSGAFADPELERLYQEVLDLDDRARLGLVASQVGLVGSLVLFVLDLRSDATPPNVPYEPERLRIGPSGDGRLELGYALPAGAPPLRYSGTRTVASPSSTISPF